MSDSLVNAIRKENYMLEIFDLTKDRWYIKSAKNIVTFVNTLYRSIEPSHFLGEIVVSMHKEESFILPDADSKLYYDSGILSHGHNSMVFFLPEDNDIPPKIWLNTSVNVISDLERVQNDSIVYYYNGSSQKETFIVNGKKLEIQNHFSCPSIFALQYHYLNEALLDYKNDRIKNISCEHFKKCWGDQKYIYLKNKPEDCMQISLSEFLKNRIRGVNIVREYNLGASKPVDVRVYWREANRSALIELKWVGQSLKTTGEMGTEYTNNRVNDGMKQIKEYLDLCKQDTPSAINKGYLVVIDARRNDIKRNKVESISMGNGTHYANKDFEIDEKLRYWTVFPDVNEPIRMFAYPIYEL